MGGGCVKRHWSPSWSKVVRMMQRAVFARSLCPLDDTQSRQPCGSGRVPSRRLARQTARTHLRRGGQARSTSASVVLGALARHEPGLLPPRRDAAMPATLPKTCTQPIPHFTASTTQPMGFHATRIIRRRLNPRAAQPYDYDRLCSRKPDEGTLLQPWNRKPELYHRQSRPRNPSPARPSTDGGPRLNT